MLDDKLNESESFLRDYMLNAMWKRPSDPDANARGGTVLKYAFIVTISIRPSDPDSNTRGGHRVNPIYIVL